MFLMLNDRKVVSGLRFYVEKQFKQRVPFCMAGFLWQQPGTVRDLCGGSHAPLDAMAGLHEQEQNTSVPSQLA